MSKPLLCRLGYHKFGAWEDVPIVNGRKDSGFSPRTYMRRRRRCTKCQLEHFDYSPQVGVLVTPPDNG